MHFRGSTNFENLQGLDQWLWLPVRCWACSFSFFPHCLEHHRLAFYSVTSQPSTSFWELSCSSHLTPGFLQSIFWPVRDHLSSSKHAQEHPMLLSSLASVWCSLKDFLRPAWCTLGDNPYTYLSNTAVRPFVSLFCFVIRMTILLLPMQALHQFIPSSSCCGLC